MALSVLPTWLTPFVFINACRTSFCCLSTDERSSMVTFFTKCSHYTSLVTKVTIVQNSASESSHGTVLGSALNHNVGITAVGVHEVEHVGGLATMATINLFEKTLGAGSPKGARRMSPTALALSAGIIDWWEISYLASHCSLKAPAQTNPRRWLEESEGWAFLRPCSRNLISALEAASWLPARQVSVSQKVVAWKTSDHQRNIKTEKKSLSSL